MTLDEWNNLKVGDYLYARVCNSGSIADDTTIHKFKIIQVRKGKRGYNVLIMFSYYKNHTFKAYFTRTFFRTKEEIEHEYRIHKKNKNNLR